MLLNLSSELTKFLFVGSCTNKSTLLASVIGEKLHGRSNIYECSYTKEVTLHKPASYVTSLHLYGTCTHTCTRDADVPKYE